MSVAHKLQEKAPKEFGLSANVKLQIRIEDEGHESPEFFKGIGGSNRHLYVSLSGEKEQKNLDHTSRLFHLTSLSGTFCASEISAPCRNSKLTIPFPFQQSHLYEASQPGLCVVLILICCLSLSRDSPFFFYFSSAFSGLLVYETR